MTSLYREKRDGVEQEPHGTRTGAAGRGCSLVVQSMAHVFGHWEKKKKKSALGNYTGASQDETLWDVAAK